MENGNIVRFIKKNLIEQLQKIFKWVNCNYIECVAYLTFSLFFSLDPYSVYRCPIDKYSVISLYPLQIAARSLTAHCCTVAPIHCKSLLALSQFTASPSLLHRTLYCRLISAAPFFLLLATTLCLSRANDTWSLVAKGHAGSNCDAYRRWYEMWLTRTCDNLVRSRSLHLDHFTHGPVNYRCFFFVF